MAPLANSGAAEDGESVGPEDKAPDCAPLREGVEQRRKLPREVMHGDHEVVSESEDPHRGENGLCQVPSDKRVQADGKHHAPLWATLSDAAPCLGRRRPPSVEVKVRGMIGVHHLD